LIANVIVALLLFLQHEAFYLLPKEVLVAPGVFRMSDALLVIAPVFVLSIPGTFSRYREESLLVISFLLLMLMSCLMGSYFFPQTYFEGILNIRRNFAWISFFMFIPLIRNLEQAERLVKFLTFLTGIYVLILILTKFFPNLGIIHFPKRVYDLTSSLIRFGEFRLFFPYGNISLMLFFIALAQLLNGGMKESFITQAMRLAFISVVSYAVVASMTRAVIYPVLTTVAFAFIRSKVGGIKAMAITFAILLIAFQVASSAISTSGSSILENTKLGKMLLKSDELAPEAGRLFQVKMYLMQFARSPITGVGNFAIGKYTNHEDGVQKTIKEFGFFNGSDLGYLKILAENGLIGVAWVIWWFSYFYRRSRQTAAESQVLGGAPFAEVLIRGLFLFNVYLFISGVTLGHWVHPNVLTILPLSLALMAIARVSVKDGSVSQNAREGIDDRHLRIKKQPA
jgi:hypothetical protein